MITSEGLVRRRVLLGIMLLGCMTLIGCDKLFGVRIYRWTEEVRLEDGSVITIKRQTIVQSSRPFGGGPVSAKELAATITFTGPLKSLPTWRFPRLPLLLYKNAKTLEWVVVASASSSTEISKHGNFLYWEYRAKERGWREVPISPESFDRSANLFFSYGRIKENHVSVKDTEELLVNPLTYAPYRRITRE